MSIYLKLRMAYVFYSIYLILAWEFYCIGHCNCGFSDVDGNKWNGCLRRKSELKCNGLQRDIPEGVTSVHLIIMNVSDRILKRETFSSETWKLVTKLFITANDDWSSEHTTVFDNMCFYGLKNLEILRISMSVSIEFRPETLIGMSNLKLLDLSGCRRFYLDNLINALNSTNAVPNLSGLNMSLFNTYRMGLRLNDSFFKIVTMKRIKELDLSSTQVLYMNLTSFKENCNSLEFINISRMMLNDYDFGSRPSLCKNMKRVDASYILLPSQVIPDYGPPTVVYENTSVPFFFSPLFFIRNIEYVNLTGAIVRQTRYVLKNMTVYLVGMSKFNLRTLVLRDNNVERLDVKIFSKHSKLEFIDLSKCNIRFLHPMALSSFSLLKIVDLSENRLNDMEVENSVLFESLFRNLTLLRNVNLSNNHLKNIPTNIFKFNRNLETIDLSSNLLSQISFDVGEIHKLRTLNLERNVFKILDSISLKTLTIIKKPYHNFYPNSSNTNALFMLKNNPFSCSSCHSLDSITWLYHSRVSIEHASSMTCQDNHGNQVVIDKSVLDSIQTICDRPKVIITSCISVVSVMITSLVIIFVIRTRRRRRAQELEMADRIALIREGAENYRFVVFLSYCSKDEEFVEKYVYNSLNEHLQNMIGDDRDLVCEGDRNFQLGRPIHDQISRLLERSSVVIIVLTDNYSQSIHCRNESDQAFMLEKPMMLMVKDEVNTGLMTPLIRDLYEKKTRVLWMWADGQYQLKTTWENLCSSIVELVDKN